jgi:hypothetical protein
MLETIHEHTLDTSLLKPGCKVLDVGCLGFAFGNELRRRFQADVYEVDIGYLEGDQPYYHCGIAAEDGFGDVENDAQPEARRLVPGESFKVFTLESFGPVVGVNHWDAIKLDCEGSEYDILWNLQRPLATQISVEFHQHTEARRSEEFVANLVERLQQWYEVRQHGISGRKHSRNYWDSLFVLKAAL